MDKAIEQFRSNIDRTNNLGAIYQAFEAQTTEVLDLSDILRAEFVMVVSALDHYIHEIVRLRMLDAFHGKIIQTPAFLRFKVQLGNTIQGITNPGSDTWLEEQIIEIHSYQSFQLPDKIADAIRLISEIQLWQEVAKILNMTDKEVKQKLILIVNRRNQIAHEADMDPSFPGRRWTIDKKMVDDASEFMKNVAETIHSLVQ